MTVIAYGIGGVYDDYIVTDFIYAIPRYSVFTGTLEGENRLMLGNDKGKNTSAIKVKLNITDTAKPCSRAYVYNLLTP